MTAQEIKDLIMSKIAGQGSAVDAGSALPEILNGIVDAIEENKPEDEFTLVSPFWLPDNMDNLNSIDDEDSFLQYFPNGNILLSKLKQANNRDVKVKEVIFDSQISKLRLACIMNEVAGDDHDENWNGYFIFGGRDHEGNGAIISLGISWNHSDEVWGITCLASYV